MRRRRSVRKASPSQFGLVAILLGAFLLWQLPQLAFVAAAILLLAAFVIWYTGARLRLEALHRWAAVSNLYTLSPEGFERHVASTYERLGYKVVLTKRVADQGIDVIAERDSERLGIQCKRTTETVSNRAVQEAYAGKAHYGCTAGAVVSLGGFTLPARALAATTGITLIDGAQYADLFHRASASVPARSAWTTLPSKRSALSAILCAAIGLIAAGIGSTRMTSSASSWHATGANVSTVERAEPSDVVARFYAAIDTGDFGTAYSLLSPSFKAEMTFDRFREGYKTTASVTATIRRASGSTVNVHLVARDRTPAGSYITSVFEGHWDVVPDRNGSWLLNEGSFRRM